MRCCERKASAAPEKLLALTLESKSCSELNRPWASGTERLERALRRLPEPVSLPGATGESAIGQRTTFGQVIQREVVPGQVRDVEGVEHFRHHGEFVVFFNGEYLGQAEVLGKRRIAELVIGWQHQLWDSISFGILSSSQSVVPAGDGLHQTRLAACNARAVVIYARKGLASGDIRSRQRYGPNYRFHRGTADDRRVHAQR